MKKRDPETLKKCLKRFKKSWTDFDNLLNLKNKWNEIVGKELSNQCKPLKIEKGNLTIVANHPQWRHALIYNKHKLKESINQSGIKLKDIRIIQNYQESVFINKYSDTKKIWDEHPSRIKGREILNCKYCNSPTPIGEIERWGKCTFCWRKDH